MLTIDEIRSFIEADKTSEKKQNAAVGLRYYEGNHDILNSRFFYFNTDDQLVEDKMRSNQRICHPFFTEICDQLASYMLSFKENPIRAKEAARELQTYLDTYFDGEFWAEFSDLITGAYSKGFDYIYGYKNEENRLTFECADGMGVVEVREADADDKCSHVLYWYIDRIDKGKKTITKIQDWTEADTTFYVQVDNGDIVLDDNVAINPRPHTVFTDKTTGKLMGEALGYIPFWRLDYNKKQISGLKPIKHLIDDYDLHSCSLSNNLIDFDTPLHVVSGYPGDDLDKLQRNLKTKKIVGVDGDGSVDIKTIAIPYEARKAKLDIDERNIYKFAMGLNTYGLKDSAATTNVVMLAAYEGLNIKANKFQPRVEKLLKDIIKVVLAEINEEHKTDYQLKDIEFNFERNAMTNESENITNEKTKADTQSVRITTILNAAAEIGDEKTAELICDCLDIDYEDIKDSLGKDNGADDSLTVAKTALQGAVIDDTANVPLVGENPSPAEN